MDDRGIAIWVPGGQTLSCTVKPAHTASYSMDTLSLCHRRQRSGSVNLISHLYLVQRFRIRGHAPLHSHTFTEWHFIQQRDSFTSYCTQDYTTSVHCNSVKCFSIGVSGISGWHISFRTQSSRTFKPCQKKKKKNPIKSVRLTENREKRTPR
jgi:hypothetical protein